MFESILLLIVATSLLLGSPGPAPIALAATGATFGIKKGIPFLLGILSGLIVVIIGTTVGIATLFNAFPAVRLTVQIIGALYIFMLLKRLHELLFLFQATTLPPNLVLSTVLF